jgi:endonuclease YncB( thermonuclease family)
LPARHRLEKALEDAPPALLRHCGAVGGGGHRCWPGHCGARVPAAHDGDTLTLLTNSQTEVKVRLAGIDAPEKGQPFG